jgi:hypothetical protein
MKLLSFTAGLAFAPVIFGIGNWFKYANPTAFWLVLGTMLIWEPGEFVAVSQPKGKQVWGSYTYPKPEANCGKTV